MKADLAFLQYLDEWIFLPLHSNGSTMTSCQLSCAPQVSEFARISLAHLVHHDSFYSAGLDQGW